MGTNYKRIIITKSGNYSLGDIITLSDGEFVVDVIEKWTIDGLQEKLIMRKAEND
jgi:hypothetical protein